MSVNSLLRQALKHHRSGRHREAEGLYRDVIRSQPGHFDALHLLGVLHVDRQDFRVGARLIESALAINPAFAAAHFNLATARRHLKRYADALASYDRAIELRPEYPEAWLGRGNVLLKLARCEAAAAAFDRALAQRPDYPEALCNRGSALLRLDRPDEALTAFDAVLSAHPDFWLARSQRAEALIAAEKPTIALEELSQLLESRSDDPEVLRLHGAALAMLGRMEEALPVCERVVALRTDDPAALSLLGSVLGSLDRFEEALAALDQALRIEPRNADAHYNRGLLLVARERFAEAIDSFERAIALNARHYKARNNCGFVLARQRFFDPALELFDAAIALRPRFLPALVNKADALWKVRRFDESIACYREALLVEPNGGEWYGMYAYVCQLACDWAEHRQQSDRVLEDVLRPDSAVPPLLLMSLESSLSEKLTASRRYASSCGAQPRTGTRSPAPRPDDRIRVAYLSANFNRHPVGYSIVEMLEKHDRSRFDVHGISLGGDDGSDIRARIVSACESFHDAGAATTPKLGDLLEELQIDVAVDLMGYTEDARPAYLTYRAAAIQVNYLGYPGSMGAPFIDYILADHFVLPMDHRHGYDERVVWLPHCYLPSDSRIEIAERTPSREEEGLPPDGFVFCSFNTHYKITPGVFDTWMHILREVDGAVLWLQGNNPVAEGNLCRAAESRGVDPGRIVFAPRTEGLAQHLARHRLADLFLDTLPYNAHSTARDALWLGVPVLTCAGSSFASRVAGSALHAVGLPELVADNLGDYRQLAIALARDPGRMCRLRERLADSRLSAPLFDADRHCRHVEAAFETMVALHQGGEPPRDFSVFPSRTAARPS